MDAIDFHNHLMPAVDDGAATLEDTRNTLQAFRDQGVRTVVATPHFNASLLGPGGPGESRLAELDQAFESVLEVQRSEFPDLRVERGVELMLDMPDPDLTDPRLRLAGSRFFLVEFPAMRVPSHAAHALFDLRSRGWMPIVAHPERYRNGDEGGVLDDLLSVGCLLQINSGSLLGRYGKTAEDLAWSLLQDGSASFVSSDYHARGTLTLEASRQAILDRGGTEQAELLMAVNGQRMLGGEDPLPVPPLPLKRGFLKRILGR